jgi:ketosteroid isomerase-like protein
MSQENVAPDLLAALRKHFEAFSCRDTALYTVRGGRITRQRYFFDHAKAVKTAGLEQ